MKIEQNCKLSDDVGTRLLVKTIVDSDFDYLQALFLFRRYFNYGGGNLRKTINKIENEIHKGCRKAKENIPY